MDDDVIETNIDDCGDITIEIDNLNILQDVPDLQSYTGVIDDDTSGNEASNDDTNSVGNAFTSPGILF